MDALMSDMFKMAYPWWEFVLRATVVYIVVLLLVRLSGKRSVGQYTPFDIILVVLLGTAVQNSLIGEDYSLSGGLILAATLIVLNWLVGFVGARYGRVSEILEGAPVMLGRDGEIYGGILRRQNISAHDFHEAMRGANCSEESEVKLAILEISGRISVTKRESGE